LQKLVKCSSYGKDKLWDYRLENVCKACPSVYRQCDTGKKQNEAQHINNYLSPLSIFKFYFTPVIDLLVLETNRHYHQYLDRCDGTPSPLPYITNSKMFLFQEIIVQMGHDVCDRLED